MNKRGKDVSGREKKNLKKVVRINASIPFQRHMVAKRKVTSPDKAGVIAPKEISPTDTVHAPLKDAVA